VALIGSRPGGVRLCVPLDQILAVFRPILKAAAPHHAGHVLAFEYQDPIAPDADRVSDLAKCLRRDGLSHSVTQLHAEGAEAPASLYISSSGRKRSCHGPSILAEVVQVFQEVFQKSSSAVLSALFAHDGGLDEALFLPSGPERCPIVACDGRRMIAGV
jgi:hypothetical protein